MAKVLNKRLEKLADFLEKRVAPIEAKGKHKFDMTLWSNVGPSSPYSSLGLTPKTCGTIACALGWATVIPSFAKAGLVLSNGTPGYFPMGKPYCYFGLDAGEAFFAITEEAAKVLFLEDQYYAATLANVVERLREFARDPAAQQAVR